MRSSRHCSNTQANTLQPTPCSPHLAKSANCRSEALPPGHTRGGNFLFRSLHASLRLGLVFPTVRGSSSSRMALLWRLPLRFLLGGWLTWGGSPVGAQRTRRRLFNDRPPATGVQRGAGAAGRYYRIVFRKRPWPGVRPHPRPIIQRSKWTLDPLYSSLIHK